MVPVEPWKESRSCRAGESENIMDLFDIISNDIKEAMKAKDKVALDTLRNIKKVLLEAKTAPGAGDTVSDETAKKLTQKLAQLQEFGHIQLQLVQNLLKLQE